MKTNQICAAVLAFFSAVTFSAWGDQVRAPENDTELRFWLENMAVHHGYTVEEIRGVLGASEAKIQSDLKRFKLNQAKKPSSLRNGKIKMLPYPGGRHPRLGFLDGAIDPQRETKLSVFAPWDPRSYVVVDLPEALWSNLGLTYLAHTHIDTIWTKEKKVLPQLEWQRNKNGSFQLERTLPNGIVFGAIAEPARNGAVFELLLHNGSTAALTNLRAQVCVMLGYCPGFNAQTNANKLIQSPFVAVRDEQGKRWVITAWEPLHRAWQNPPVPCLHADPKFEDCPVGETRKARGRLWFYEGENIEAEIKRLKF